MLFLDNFTPPCFPDIFKLHMFKVFKNDEIDWYLVDYNMIKNYPHGYQSFHPTARTRREPDVT